MRRKRVNLCMSEEAWQQFRRYAQRHRLSASAAAEASLLRAVADDDEERLLRLEAVKEIAAMELAPMGSWDEMEAELERVYDACMPEGK